MVFLYNAWLKVDAHNIVVTFDPLWEAVLFCVCSPNPAAQHTEECVRNTNPGVPPKN